MLCSALIGSVPMLDLLQWGERSTLCKSLPGSHCRRSCRLCCKDLSCLCCAGSAGTHPAYGQAQYMAGT